MDYVDHTRQRRSETTKLLIENPELIGPMLHIALKTEDPISIKAAYAVECVTKKDIQLLLPHLEEFCRDIGKVHFGSAVRSMAKMAELLLDYCFRKPEVAGEILRKDQLKHLTTASFDWLIGPQKVAPKAHAMTCLFHLGKVFSWVHPELQCIIQQDYVNGSAGYKARTRLTLERIEKWQTEGNRII